MARIEDDALCLRTWDWSETSQTAVLLTREHGMIRVIAKGSRRERAPFSGGLELLSRAEAQLILKPGGTLSTLTAWELREVFPSLRHRLGVFYAGMYLAELVGHMLPEGDAHPAIYEQLMSALRSLEAGHVPERVIAEMTWHTLKDCGYRPELSSSPEQGAIGFDPVRGELCPDPGRSLPRIWRVRAETITWIRGIGSLTPSKLDGKTEVAVRAAKFLTAYADHVIGKPLVTREPFFEVRRAESP